MWFLRTPYVTSQLHRDTHQGRPSDSWTADSPLIAMEVFVHTVALTAAIDAISSASRASSIPAAASEEPSGSGKPSTRPSGTAAGTGSTGEEAVGGLFRAEKLSGRGMLMSALGGVWAAVAWPPKPQMCRLWVGLKEPG